jgi:beta-glucosidase
MNNTILLHAALKGEYPKAFVGEPPAEQMGVRPGDEKLMRASLD